MIHVSTNPMQIKLEKVNKSNNKNKYVHTGPNSGDFRGPVEAAEAACTTDIVGRFCSVAGVALATDTITWG